MSCLLHVQFLGWTTTLGSLSVVKKLRSAIKRVTCSHLVDMSVYILFTQCLVLCILRILLILVLLVVLLFLVYLCCLFLCTASTEELPVDGCFRVIVPLYHAYVHTIRACVALFGFSLSLSGLYLVSIFSVYICLSLEFMDSSSPCSLVFRLLYFQRTLLEPLST